MGDDADEFPGLSAEAEGSAAGHNRKKDAAKLATGDKRKKEVGSFSKWQDAAREQLGNTVNLVLTLSVASLGFGTNLVFKTEKGVAPLVAGARYCVLAAMALLLLAIAVALWVNLSRLSDARWSARAARLREVRDSYLAGAVIPLPKWLQEVKTPGTARIKEIEETLNCIALEREKQRSAEIENEIQSLGQPASPVKNLDPEVVKWALGVGSEPGSSASRVGAPGECASSAPGADQGGQNTPPPTRTTAQLKVDLETRLNRLDQLKRLYRTQPTNEKDLEDEVRHRALALQVAFALAAGGDDSPLMYCRERSLTYSRWTWKLLPTQFMLFAFGVFLLGVGLAWPVRLPEASFDRSKPSAAEGTQTGAPAHPSVPASARGQTALPVGR